MTVLVTGGAGFIGSHLVDRLLHEGHEVIVLDNFDSFYDPSIKRSNLACARSRPSHKIVDLDLRDAEGVRKLVAATEPEAIIHLAARAGVRPSIERPTLYAEVNVNGTINLFDAARTLDPPPRIVYASSSSVYGNRTDAPFRETDRIDQPVSPYAASKAACELYAHTYHHLYGIPMTGVRIFTAYGPRNRPDLAIHKFTRKIETGEPIPMFGDGSSRRDYTFVLDVVDGLLRALDHCTSCHLYNLGNSEPVELRLMIDLLGMALGKVPKIERLPEQPGDVQQTYADISRARRELGYNPQTTFEEGLRRFVEWYRSIKRAAG